MAPVISGIIEDLGAEQVRDVLPVLRKLRGRLDQA
jgi:hypothetical protein